jgi:plasmid stabilization system protein ParE
MALEAAYERLRTMPELGVLRSYDARRLRAVRVWPVPGFRRFLIFYRVTEDAVEVIRVLVLRE